MAANKDEGIADEVVDRLLAGRDPATVFESGGLIDELKKRLAERMLNAEMDHHLGGAGEEAAGNHRNGYGSKTVLTDTGKVELSIPRGRGARREGVGWAQEFQARWPSGDAAKLRTFLTQYLDQRLLFYTTDDQRQLQQIDTDTTNLQNQMWSIVADVSQSHPTPPIALALSGMNDVLNRQGYTQAAWWNRIPIGAWSLKLALGIFCCALIGYRAQQRGTNLLIVFPIMLSVAFFLIADIDNPRLGVIRVSPQNLISLSQSMHKE
jgi:hypothetical protein